MNILLINHYAGSPNLGMEFRPYYMAKEWNNMGHNTLIIGGSYSHLRKTQPNQNENSIIDGVKYNWIKVNHYKGNGIGRIWSMFLFVFKLFFNYKKYLLDFIPDIVIASSTYPLDIYPARRISKYYNAKLIYEVHDLWPLSPMELGGYSAKHPFIQVIQIAENYCYKHVDAVVSMLPKAEQYMKEHGLSVGKFHYVPNGIVLQDWDSPMGIPIEHENLLHKLHDEKKLIVGFTGAHGIANSLYTAIDSISGLSDNDVVFVMVGSGQEKENLIRYTNDKNYNNVFFLPPVNKLAIPTLLSKMDILYIGLQKQSLFRFGISPNKIFDYMMAAKPIIQAIDAGNNLVEEAKCGIAVEPDNVDEIRKAIIKLKNMETGERELLGENGKRFVLENHTYQVISNKFINIMNAIIR